MSFASVILYPSNRVDPQGLDRQRQYRFYALVLLKLFNQRADSNCSPSIDEHRPDATTENGRLIVTDLDGTILVEDTFSESLLSHLGTQFWCIFLIPFWRVRGRAHLKREIARRCIAGIPTLPRTDLVAFLRAKMKLFWPLEPTR
jgi:hypothetical protein